MKKYMLLLAACCATLLFAIPQKAAAQQQGWSIVDEYLDFPADGGYAALKLEYNGGLYLPSYGYPVFTYYDGNVIDLSCSSIYANDPTPGGAYGYHHSIELMLYVPINSGSAKHANYEMSFASMTFHLTIDQAAFDAGRIDPASQTVPSGGYPGTLTHVASGSIHSRQWQKTTDLWGTWTDISGAKGASYSPPASTNTGTGNVTTYYRVVVNKSVNSPGVYSSTSTLVVTPKPIVPTAYENSTTRRKLLSADGTYAATEMTFYDGLGRPVEINQVGADKAYKNDIVTPIEYDRMGRADSVGYLPYISVPPFNGISNPLSVKTQKVRYQSKFYGDVDKDYANSRNIYNTAGQVIASHGPGKSSAEHPMQYTYRMNTDEDAIKKYRMYTDDKSLEYLRTYYADELSVTIATQANLPADQTSTSVTYTNSRGQVVAKEVRKGTTDRRITYYVYDDLGRQRYVIPPVQDALLTTTGRKDRSTLTKYSYYTLYDEYGHVVEQYVPGTEPVYSIYDRRGRLAMTQDGNQRAADQWSFTKYDVLDRPVMTGVYTGGSYLSHELFLNADSDRGEARGGTLHGYTNVTYPSITNANDVYVVSYYDDYSWLSGSTHAFSSADALGNTPRTEAKGLLTGTKTKVLGITAHQWLTSVTYYDDKQRSIQNIADLYPSGKEIVSNTHNFIDQVTRTKVKQTVGTLTTEYNKWFNFNGYGRLESVEQQITGDPNRVTLAAYQYDDFGRVETKKIHNAAETTTYTYNIAGQNIEQSSPSFTYNLWSDKVPTGSGLTARHDGNLAHITWGSNSTGNQKGYTMSYDAFGQMLSAKFMQGSGSTWTPNTKFAEQGIAYDKNGNLTSLQRTSATGALTHNFTYTYDGNRLSKVNGGTAFTYDPNGNLTRDGQTSIQIEYNMLNLPRRIFGTSGEIQYIYSATGEKLASSANGSLTYYRSVMVYEKPSGGAEQLSYVLHPEGIAAKSGTNSYRYRYFKTDHLGNTRRVLEASGTTLTAVQTTDFYPFGLAHELNNTQFNRYLYGGKELQTGTVGGTMLGLYDFHARFYNPVHGRWFNVDPALQFTSPYVYAGNSPMMYRDKDGEWVWLVVAIVAGGYLGGVQQSGSWNPGNWDWSSGQLWAGIGIGAVAGLAGYGAGQAVMGTFAAAGTAGATVVQGGAISGMAAGAAGGATTGLVNGSGQAWVGGASFWEGLGQGAEQSVWGAVTGGAAGGVISGSVSAINGNNFWTGVAIEPPTPAVPSSPAQTQPTTTKQPNNPVPDRVARVVPGDSQEPKLGLPDQEQVFVTGADDVQGLNATQISEKLGLPLDPNVGFKVIEMPTPLEGISTPIRYDNQLFMGGGRTIGGAPEFNIPNGPIPGNATTTIVK